MPHAVPRIVPWCFGGMCTRTRTWAYSTFQSLPTSIQTLQRLFCHLRATVLPAGDLTYRLVDGVVHGYLTFHNRVSTALGVAIFETSIPPPTDMIPFTNNAS